MLSLPKTVRLEKDFEREALDYLNKRGDFFSWKNNNTGIYDQQAGVFRSKSLYDLKGQPDVIACKNDGTVYFLEFKKPGGRLSPDQKAFSEKLKKMNHKYFVVTTIEDVKRALDD